MLRPECLLERLALIRRVCAFRRILQSWTWVLREVGSDWEIDHCKHVSGYVPLQLLFLFALRELCRLNCVSFTSRQHDSVSCLALSRAKGLSTLEIRTLWKVLILPLWTSVGTDACINYAVLSTTIRKVIRLSTRLERVYEAEGWLVTHMSVKATAVSDDLTIVSKLNMMVMDCCI